MAPPTLDPRDMAGTAPPLMESGEDAARSSVTALMDRIRGERRPSA